MALKLFQVKQNIIINWIANAKSMVLNRENNLAAWDLRSKREKAGISIIEKDEDRSNKNLKVRRCWAGAGMAGKLLVSALHLLSLV